MSIERPQSPIRSLFILVAILLTLLFGAYANLSWRQVGDDTGREVSHALRLFGQTSRELFQLHESLLKLLGEHLRETDAISHPESARALAENLLRLNPGLAGIGLARPDGQLILVTTLPPGTRLPNLAEGENTAKTFYAALNGHGLVVGRSYYMKLLESWVMPIRVAIRNAQGETVLVITSGINLEAPNSSWAALSLEESIQIGLLHQEGYWDYLQPTLSDDKAKAFGRAVSAEVLNAIRKISTQKGARSGVPLHDDKRHTVAAEWIADYGMYAVAAIPDSVRLVRFLSAMRLPVLVYLTLMGGILTFYFFTAGRQKEFENQLIFQATHDPLTGLPNRSLLMDRLEQAIQGAADRNLRLAVFMVDLDHFKRINDRLGHMVGDRLLVVAAERLKRHVRNMDTVARFGGDEFVIVLADLHSPRAAEQFAEQLLNAFGPPFRVDEHELFSPVSVGIAIWPQDGEDGHQLIQNVDAALFQAKAAGRNSYRFFSNDLNEQAMRRVAIEHAMRKALDKREFRLVYQPRVDLETQHWVGAEALLRWRSEQLGDVSPLEFIPVAEDTGLIRQLGRFVVSQALDDLLAIREISQDALFRLSLNVSVKEMQHGGVAQFIGSCLAERSLPPELIEVEVTESLFSDDVSEWDELRGLGVGVAIDDFGTGYSSLSYLKHFPVTTLKVDRAFVRDIELDPADAALSQAVVALGHALSLEVVAEGIENENQLSQLKGYGCQLGQGYLFSPPIELETFLERFGKQVAG